MPKNNKKQVHYIYKIIFLCGKPGRYYLGKHSGQLDDCYAGSGSFCKAYYKKYGKKLGKTYIKEILEINPNKKVNALREKEIIGDLYKSDPLCMNFIKGMILGTMVSAGIAIAYTETMGQNKKKLMKKGKQMIKKMGII